MIEASEWQPYCGAAPVPSDWLTQWNLDPLLLAALAIWPLAQARLVEGPPRAHLCFWVAWGLTAALFVSPLCALSSALFSVRVAHHAILALIVAPLLVASWPNLRARGGLLGATLLHVATLWFWHAPPAYAWALSSDMVFWAMQLSILTGAVLFWAAIGHASAPAAASMLLFAMMAMGLLGALITFAPVPLYAPHLLTTVPWGWQPLEDQQVAGLIMWVPAALAYLAAALWRFRSLLGIQDGAAGRATAA